MKEIRFCEDFEKLPVGWPETEATLVGVYNERVEVIKNRFSDFLKRDTKVRGEERYYGLDFAVGLILVFIHHNSGEVFTTIRKSSASDWKYYTNCIKCTFVLKDTRLNK